MNPIYIPNLLLQRLRLLPRDLLTHPSTSSGPGSHGAKTCSTSHCKRNSGNENHPTPHSSTHDTSPLTHTLSRVLQAALLHAGDVINPTQARARVCIPICYHDAVDPPPRPGRVPTPSMHYFCQKNPSGNVGCGVLEGCVRVFR